MGAQDEPRTPRQDGLRWPAEWEPHSRCWMAWPSHKAWWGDHIGAAREAYSAVASAIAEFEPVVMVSNPETAAEASLHTGKGVSVVSLPIDDSWLRDNGPTFLVDAAGDVAGVSWQWNAWGNLYPDYQRDAALAGAILQKLNMRRYDAPMVLEGGAVHGDGEGTLIATEQCLLNPNRNPDMDRAAVERMLSDYLVVDRIIWLGRGLVDDETQGHVDNIACFVRPGVVMALCTRNKKDANYDILEENLERLRSATDAHNRSLEVIEIEQPAAEEVDGKRLPLSYINFYIANDAVIVPQFEDSRDSKALAAISAAFPNRTIVPVRATDICVGGGGVHCITRQQPAGEPLPPR